MSRNEQRLEKAKKLYPIGTKFTSLFGADDVVTEQNEFFGKRASSHYLGDFDTIMVFGENQTRLIYDNGNWAKIID